MFDLNTTLIRLGLTIALWLTMILPCLTEIILLALLLIKLLTYAPNICVVNPCFITPPRPAPPIPMLLVKPKTLRTLPLPLKLTVSSKAAIGNPPPWLTHVHTMPPTLAVNLTYEFPNGTTWVEHNPALPVRMSRLKNMFGEWRSRDIIICLVLPTMNAVPLATQGTGLRNMLRTIALKLLRLGLA